MDNIEYKIFFKKGSFVKDTEGESENKKQKINFKINNVNLDAVNLIAKNINASRNKVMEHLIKKAIVRKLTNRQFIKNNDSLLLICKTIDERSKNKFSESWEARVEEVLFPKEYGYLQNAIYEEDKSNEYLLIKKALQGDEE